MEVKILKLRVAHISKSIRKRVYISILIIAKLVNKLGKKNIKLNIYGYGSNEELDVLNNLILKYNLTDYVTIFGPTPHDQILPLFDSSDFILSFYVNTNLTNPVLEAFFLGCPVITLADKNILELADSLNLNHGLIVEEESEDQVINTVSNYLLESDLGGVREYRARNFKSSVTLASWESRIAFEVENIKKFYK